MDLKDAEVRVHGRRCVVTRSSIEALTCNTTEASNSTAHSRVLPSVHPLGSSNPPEAWLAVVETVPLSDPVARENWEKYGNPDGKGTVTELALGLPTILVHAQGKYVFLGIYILLLGVALPSLMRAFHKKAESRAALVDAIGDCGLLTDTNRWVGLNLAPAIDARLMPALLGGIAEGRRSAPLPDADVAEMKDVWRELTQAGAFTAPPAFNQYVLDPRFTPAQQKDFLFCNTVLVTAHLYRRALGAARARRDLRLALGRARRVRRALRRHQHVARLRGGAARRGAARAPLPGRLRRVARVWRARHAGRGPQGRLRGRARRPAPAL
jgi:hypothetical protein